MNRYLPSLLVLLLAGAALLAVSACQPASQSAGLSVPTGSTGNPPLIPHEVDPADGGAECSACHAKGENGAPKYPAWHATLVDCLQCHVTEANQGIKPFKPKY
ncbi:MAG: hypothetical protein Tsb0017_28420 [Geothermobacteraceae bacterium]